jgi:hypothetical protein
MSSPVGFVATPTRRWVRLLRALPEGGERREEWHQACLRHRVFGSIEMNLFTGATADEFFGGEVPAGVREILHRVAQAPLFIDNGPARFWLFTLKARALLAQIARLDPAARVGDDVIASLLASLGRE